MTFALTNELTKDIISAMENQETVFVVDAATESIAELNEKSKPDDSQYYKLPEWNSAEGFVLRESFTANLHVPVVQEELQEILHSGRGVFKNFRNCLRKYPEIDKRWHIFKYKYMSARINDWYNSLRTVWGLGKLDYLEESEESLVYDDFSFSIYDSSKDKNEILFNISAFLNDTEQQLPEQIKLALYKMWCSQFELADSKNQSGFVCKSLSNDFAGCITGCAVSETQDDIMLLTSLYVPETFRGLGIGTELISMFINRLNANGKKWIIMPENLIPEFLEPLLTRIGFEKIRYGYMAEIQKTKN